MHRVVRTDRRPRMGRHPCSDRRHQQHPPADRAGRRGRHRHCGAADHDEQEEAVIVQKGKPGRMTGLPFFVYKSRRVRGANAAKKSNYFSISIRK